MKPQLVLALAAIAFALSASLGSTGAASSLDPGVGNVPQGTQGDKAYAQSFQKAGVTNVFVTTQQTSCYRPEVSATAYNDGPANGYSGESACLGATTGEDTGASGLYATQIGSNPGSPMTAPQLVKDHSESDIRVDPTNPSHLIGSSKWFVSPEGYNHQLGFYESFDGGQTWPVQGHIPGFEGWTDDTDPVGAFDGFGNYYEFNLAYQFFYNKDGSHNFTVGTSQEPNPAEPAEVVGVVVRPHGSTTATQWITTRNGKPDIVASYDSVGNEPDKQWIAIDDNPSSPHYNRVYAMWVDFHRLTPVPFVSFADALPNGTHSDWSAPQALPTPPHTPQGSTYLLPHVASDGTVYTTITNFNPKQGFCCATVFVDRSADGGQTWSVAGTAASNVSPPPSIYPNTTFRDGIENTFAVGANGALYVAYEDYSAGIGNVLLTTSHDGGATWTTPIQVNDNASPVDEFQPNLTVAHDGTVSIAFYDRRLACPTGTEAAAAGLGLDPNNPTGASNYCVNASLQFYAPDLTPIGHNVRLTQHTWDPQLNAPHPGSPGGTETFIGDYFGNETSGSSDVTSFVSTFDDGSNPAHQQQQVMAKVTIP
ncbi:MAG TPA: sialidase family protein [Gaiellaceae bacterium]|nr:sialidase family protein [Gaiellaceae bacterium]